MGHGGAAPAAGQALPERVPAMQLTILLPRPTLPAFDARLERAPMPSGLPL
jgi:hypothetical protein